jgi:hypothetical protein
MPGRLRGDERSARSSRTGIHRIATSGKIIATLAAIVTVRHEQLYAKGCFAAVER